MRINALASLIILFAIAATVGCSMGHAPTTPAVNEGAVELSSNTHNIWGMYAFICDPTEGTLEVVPMRVASLHLNTLPFLEDPPNIYISIESLEFVGDILEADIGLTHPFFGLTQFTGFDVCGIIFSHGSVSGFNDPDLVMAGEGDTRLLNPDGYSRWWNPAEFPHGDTVFNYVEGLMGTPSGTADYNTTINGYKYFADDLGPDDPLTVLDLSKRGMLSAGAKNIRHYSIDLSGGFIFNYAVDACWEQPSGDIPWEIPGDFGPDANRPEARMISVTESINTLYYEGPVGAAGGDLELLIDVYDWFDAELNQVCVESLSGLPYTTSATPVGGGEGYSTYSIDLTGNDLNENGDIDLLITVQCEKSGYGGLLPGKPVCSYFMQSTYVSSQGPGDGWELIFPDPPVQLSDSAWYDCNNLAPGIIIDGAGNIAVAWGQMATSAAEQEVRPVDRMSPDSGENWNPMDSFEVTCYDRDGYLTGTKMALDGNGDAYALNFWVDEEGTFPTFWCNYLIRCPFNSDDDWGWQTSMSIHGVDLVFSEDHYPICFEDYDLLPGYDGIQAVKGLYQNSPMGLASGQWDEHSWWVIGQYYQAAPEPARISTGPSVQRNSSGIIWLAYMNDLDSDEIHMVYNTDNTIENWSPPLSVVQASPPDLGCYDPTLWLDPDGGMHLGYIVKTDGSPATYTLKCMNAPSGEPGDLGSEEEAFMDTSIMSHPTLQCADLPIGRVKTALTLVDTVVNVVWRDPVTEDWSPPIQVDVISEAGNPSMWIEQDDLYVHVVWDEPDAQGHGQIWYRRGQFVEQ